MAVIYQGSDNKYELSTVALKSASSERGFLASLFSFFEPIGGAVNTGLEIISSLILGAQENTNTRRADEQGYLLKSDAQGYNAESKANEKVFIIVIAAIILVIMMQKK